MPVLGEEELLDERDEGPKLLARDGNVHALRYYKIPSSRTYRLSILPTDSDELVSNKHFVSRISVVRHQN